MPDMTQDKRRELIKELLGIYKRTDYFLRDIPSLADFILAREKKMLEELKAREAQVHWKDIEIQKLEAKQVETNKMLEEIEKPLKEYRDMFTKKQWERCSKEFDGDSAIYDALATINKYKGGVR